MPHLQANSARKHLWLWALLLSLIAYPLLFLHLENLTVRTWDEARLAVNAAELSVNHHWLAYTYADEPDMWNTKPPLMIWAQALCMKAFGISELSVRLPAALAGFFACFLLLWFGARHHHPVTGLSAALLTALMPGCNAIHVFRTGDFDAFLVFFTTATVLFFYEWMEATPPAQRKWAILTALALMLGIMSKGVAALFVTPVLAGWLLLSGRAKAVLVSRYFLMASAVVLIPVLAYYLGRESINPGYLQAVWDNELGGRFGTPLEKHDHPWFYYLELIWTEQKLAIVLYGLPVMILSWVMRFRDPLARMSAYLFICATGILLVISFAQTKLAWYDAPVYPLFALAFALSAASLLSPLLALSATGSRAGGWVAMGFLFVIAGEPYTNLVRRNYLPETKDMGIVWGQERIGYCLRRTRYQDIVVYDNPDFAQHSRFYILMHRSKGKNVRRILTDNLSPGQIVLFATSDGRQWLNDHYLWETIDTFSDIPDGTMARIINHK